MKILAFTRQIFNTLSRIFALIRKVWDDNQLHIYTKESSLASCLNKSPFDT